MSRRVDKFSFSPRSIRRNHPPTTFVFSHVRLGNINLSELSLSVHQASVYRSKTPSSAQADSLSNGPSVTTMLIPARILSLAVFLTAANALPYLGFFGHTATYTTTTTTFPTLSVTTANPTATSVVPVGTGTGTTAPASTGTGASKHRVKKSEAQLAGYLP